jgi:hypothetical protein
MLEVTLLTTLLALLIALLIAAAPLEFREESADRLDDLDCFDWDDILREPLEEHLSCGCCLE